MDKSWSFKANRMLQRASEIATRKNDIHSNELSKEKGLVLLDNVQFIYELALAQLELDSLGVQFEMANSLREFVLVDTKDEEMLKRRLAYFKSIRGRPTDYSQIIQKNRTRSVNQYLTHWIYPYKGKFHPQMIRALLNIIGLQQGDTVLDPFIGSGTTAVEAQLLGINCIGIDVSPLCILQSKVKTESVDAFDEILEWKGRFTREMELSLFDAVGKKINSLINEIDDPKVSNFYKMAKLVAVSDNIRRKKSFYNSFLRNLEQMIKSVSDYIEVIKDLHLVLGSVDIREGDSRCLPFENNSIDGIITSPPYSIALDYVANDAHALKDLGYDPDEVREKFIGVRGKPQSRSELDKEDMMKS